MLAPPIVQAKNSKPEGSARRSLALHRKPLAALCGSEMTLLNFPAPQNAIWEFGKLDFHSSGHAQQQPVSQEHVVKAPRDPGAHSGFLHILQAKSLANTVAADAREQEADRVADHIVSTPMQQLANRPPTASDHALTLRPTRSSSLEAPGAPSNPRQFLAAVRRTLQSTGEVLDHPTRLFMESRFRFDFSKVRIHADMGSAQSAAEVRADAFTVGPHIAFAAGRYRPGTAETQRLLAHELVHVVQQGAASPLGVAPPGSSARLTTAVSPAPRLDLKSATQDLQASVELDQYQTPEGNIYRVGDAAGTKLLMEIGQEGQQVTFRVFDFENGLPEEMSADQWSQQVVVAGFGGGLADLRNLGSQLTPAQWKALWPNPVPELLRKYEAGKISFDDKAVLSTYRGMIRSDARRILNENERALDALLDARDRVARLQEYADGLREASQVRDALVHRKNEITHSLVVQHSFTFGPLHAGTGPDTFQNMKLHQALGEVEDTLSTWYAAFPMLTRLSTQDISAETVEARLRAIKGNIIAARQDMSSGALEPMKMDNVRAGLVNKLGPKATAVVAAEDKANARAAVAGAVALTALTIALLFIPGGAFIDAAIGIAMAASAINDAMVLGRAANTSMHVDDGLVSQEAAQSARFNAVLATVFAIMGTAAAGLRVLRVARALVRVSGSMPELAIAERAAVARAIANDSKLVSALGGVAKDDTAITARVSAAVRSSAGNMGALRTSLNDIAFIAAIPRRATAAGDAYEPIRKIVDGSDIEGISKLTGFSRTEVSMAKQHLMLDEHILVDDTTGALYRGRFTAIESDAKIWQRVARSEHIAETDRQALGQLIRHEIAEGTELARDQQTLESLFVRGELESKLRTFLQSKGQTKDGIEAMLQNEPRPITPARYAHYFAHFTTGPNPGSRAAMRLPLPKPAP